MKTNILKQAVILALGTLFVGCIAPKSFKYKIDEQGARRSGTQFENVLIAVMPMTDSRTDRTSTEGWSWLSFLPLVPCMPYHNYDMEHYSADTGQLKFCATNDLRSAVVEHLKYDGMTLVSTVILPRAKLRQYTLEVNISTLGIDGYRTLYCLGLFPGCYVAILGAPFSYSTSNLGLDFRLKNPDGVVVLEKTYSASRQYCVGEYYNWNLFKQVGFNLAEIMNSACADIAQAIAKDCPDAELTRRE